MTITRFSTGLRKDDMLAGNTSFAASDMELISTIRVGSGGASSVTFSAIPQEYKHLQLRSFFGTSIATAAAYVKLNSDSGSNYAWHYIQGSGSAASANNGTSQTNALLTWNSPGAVTTSPGDAVMDILDYSVSSKYKTMRCLAGYDANGSGYIFLTSGLWMSNSSVTTIALTLSSGNFVQYSRFSLYGIRG